MMWVFKEEPSCRKAENRQEGEEPSVCTTSGDLGLAGSECLWEAAEIQEREELTETDGSFPAWSLEAGCAVMVRGAGE